MQFTKNALIVIFMLSGVALCQDNSSFFESAFKKGLHDMEKILTKYPAQCVSDTEIRNALDNVMLGEQSTDKKTSLSLADQTLGTIKNKPLLHSWIYNNKAYIFQTQDNYQEAVKMFIASTNLLDSLYAEVTMQRQETLLKLGSSYYRLGDKENADKAFLAAYSFPYWTFPRISLDSKRRVEVVYRRSITGLIMARAGNAQKLKEIRIIPAANDLMPKLEEAIRRAEGKLD